MNTCYVVMYTLKEHHDVSAVFMSKEDAQEYIAIFPDSDNYFIKKSEFYDCDKSYGCWIDDGVDKFICSKCDGYVYRMFGRSKYCPHCGRKMTQENE